MANPNPVRKPTPENLAPRWTPGQSGNPSGISKLQRQIKFLAQKYGEECIEFLVNMMRNEDAETKDRIACARELLNRGFGAPQQSVALGAEVKDGVARFTLLVGNGRGSDGRHDEQQSDV